MELFILNIIGALVAKLKTSADDIIWLPPFIQKNKYSSSIFYLIAINAIVLLAWITVRLFHTIIGDSPYISLVSSLLLMGFALFYLRRNSVNGNPSDKETQKNVFVISIIGSIDEFFFFTVLFSTNVFSLLPSILGISLAGALIILVCSGLNQLDWYLKVSKKIETWLIIFIIGLIGLVFSVSKLI
ncbi:MAG: hypothetical protein AAFY76_01295 [Cyanobacteria bacterium J06649_11]